MSDPSPKTLSLKASDASLVPLSVAAAKHAQTLADWVIEAGEVPQEAFPVSIATGATLKDAVALLENQESPLDARIRWTSWAFCCTRCTF